MLALVALHNVPLMIWNQRELPRNQPKEVVEWFHISPRDIEKVASGHPRSTVYGQIGIWHFLGKKISGTHLTIPQWMGYGEWQIEGVAGIEVAISKVRMTIGPADARQLRRAGEMRTFQRGARGNRRLVPLYLVRDPAARRYVLVDLRKRGELFVLPEALYDALPSKRTEPP